MPNPTLERFIHGEVIMGDPELAALLYEADSLEGCALYNPDFYKAAFPYVGRRIESILGFSADELMTKGVPKIFECTLLSDLPHLTARQSMYMQMVTQPDFDLRTILMQHFKFTAIWPSGEQVKVQVTGVILNFNEHREFRTGVGFILKDTPDNALLLKTCQNLLSKIKDRHNAIWDHPSGSPGTPYLIQYIDQTHQGITYREREVLGLLARGYSTKQVADKLGVSLHTIETHRKHLLEKFHAKNSAELIGKAGKVFWLAP
jgi:DNA-binding CsgD family transcriptional regulator